MIRLLDRLARPFVTRLDPEDAHGLVLAGLKLLPLPPPPASDPRLALRVGGIEVPNPIGLAAGFDKQAEVADACLALGFGFVEVGGVTPRPQPGNPRPRVFRLEEDGAVINRYGLNSDGVDVVASRLAARRGAGVVGVNIGPNKDSADRIADYVTLVRALAPHVAFLTVNVSSPNTPGLRDLQGMRALDDILARAIEARDGLDVSGHRPAIWLKIAPDISLDDLDDVVSVALARGVDALVIANTTVARPASLTSRHAGETGGLSGRPLFAPSTRLLAEAFRRVGPRLPLVGCGGIDSGAAAVAKVRAGASLVQLYTALVYRGFGLVDEIREALLAEVTRNGADSLSALVGRDAEIVARG